MKKLLIPIVFFITFLSCEKTESDNIKYSKTTEGGCFLDKGSSLKKGQYLQPDTVTYSFTNDSLNLFVGFNATCCSEYNSSTAIKGDSILIKIINTQIGLCNCLCYYTYNFKFAGNAIAYKYHVSGSDLNFTGQIKP
jgi:hypothetical protein